jgi:hypothetical protein
VNIRGITFLLAGLIIPVHADSLSTVTQPVSHSEQQDTVLQKSPDNDSGSTVQSQLSAKTILPSGILFGSFSKADGPFLLTGNVIVPSGQILEFSAGCTVYVGGKYSTITIFGQLFARGTSEEPVVFRSANVSPQPWDWDRIYCRSRNRSLFEYCVISHSNYGIYVENGSVGVNNCIFSHNSLHGLVVKNGEAFISRSTFTGGHITALSILSGGKVTGDSLIFKDNLTAVSCQDQSVFNLNKGIITLNTNGIVAGNESSVEIVAAEITRNTNGVVTTSEIPKKMREMVYANRVEVKIAPSDEIRKLQKEPLPVASVVVPEKSAKEGPSLPEDFKAGFSALNAPREPSTSFIGNVKTGFKVFLPESRYHPRDRDTVETYTMNNDSTYDTLRTVKRVMNRQTKYPGEQSDKAYSGIQPELQFFANGRRGNTDINLLMDLYSNEWLSTARYVGKNMFNLSLNYEKQNVVFGDFFESASETSLPGRQVTGIKYTGNFFDMGRGDKRFECKLAAGETEVAKDSGDHEVFVYNQSVDTGMSKRQQLTYIAEINYKPTRLSTVTARGIIARDQTENPLFRKSISDPAAPDPVLAQTGCIGGTVLLFDKKIELYGEVDLGTADTVSDSTSEDIAWYNPRVEKAAPAVFSLLNKEDFRNHYAGTVGMRGKINGYATTIKYLQISPSYSSAGDPYMVNWRKNMCAQVDKQLNQKLDLTGSYEFDRSTIKGFGDDFPPTVTDLNIMSIDATYDMGGILPSFSLDYTIQHKKNDARESVDLNDSSYSENYDDLEFSNRISLEGKQRFNNGISYSTRYQLLWDNDYSEHPDKRLDDEGDRIHNAWSGWVTVRIKRLLRNKTSFRLAFKHENRDSLRAYQYKISDQLSLQIIPRKLSCTVGGEYMRKSEKEYGTSKWLTPMLTNYYAGELEVKYSITSRISSSVMGRYEKSYDEITGSSENYTARIFGIHLTYLF